MNHCIMGYVRRLTNVWFFASVWPLALHVAHSPWCLLLGSSGTSDRLYCGVVHLESPPRVLGVVVVRVASSHSAWQFSLPNFEMRSMREGRSDNTLYKVRTCVRVNL